MDRPLKQRLVGATILIALAVIFVPWWVGTPDTRVERGDTIDLPEPPAGNREVRRLRLDDSQPSRAEPGQVQTRPVVQDLPEPEPVRQPDPDVTAMPQAGVEPSVTAPVVEREPEVETQPPPAPVAQPVVQTTPNEGDWLVQVASFSNAEVAGGLITRLEGLGYPAVTDTVIRGETRLHRVRAGPFAERSAADAALQRIVRDIGNVQPAVVRVGGDTGDEANAPAGRYAVQVGVFAREENAGQLRERLAANGFTAFVNAETSGTHTTWRVRVGPVMERDEAVRLRDRLRAEANTEGMIVSHP